MFIGMFLYALMAVAGLVSLVCFIMVLVQMFERGATTIAIVSLVLAICTGVGVLIAFVYGWMHATKWGIRNVMVVWSLSIVVSFVSMGLLAGTVMLQMNHEMQQMPPMQPEFRLLLPAAY